MTGFYPRRRSARSSSRKPAHSKSRLKTMRVILYLYCSSYFSFWPIVKGIDDGLIRFALHMIVI